MIHVLFAQQHELAARRLPAKKLRACAFQRSARVREDVAVLRNQRRCLGWRLRLDGERAKHQREGAEGTEHRSLPVGLCCLVGFLTQARSHGLQQVPPNTATFESSSLARPV